MQNKGFLERIGVVSKGKHTELLKENKLLKENLQNQINAIAERFGKSTWGNKFLTNIYKDQILYPHDEMQRASKAFNYNSYVFRASKTRANFMTGGEIRVAGASQIWADKVNKIIQESRLSYCISEVGEDLIVSGNSYLEKIRKSGKIIAYLHIPKPEYIYVQVDDNDEIEYYVQEIKESNYSSAKHFEIKYYGDIKKAVRGIRLEKDDVMRLTLGTATIPIYGRGAVCTLVNDIEVVWEIERAMAVIARYKAIPKKFLSPKTENTNPQLAEWLSNQISSLSDFENPISPYPLDVQDLSYSGSDLNIQPMLDYMKKKLTVPLAPSFLMHGEETNYAVSHDQKASFELEIRSERNDLAQQLKPHIDELILSHGMALQEYEIEFGEYDLGQTEVERKATIENFNAGLITLNEAREILGYDADKEKGDMYAYELRSDSNAFADLLGDVDEDIDQEAERLNQQDRNRGE